MVLPASPSCTAARGWNHRSRLNAVCAGGDGIGAELEGRFAQVRIDRLPDLAEAADADQFDQLPIAETAAGVQSGVRRP